MSEPSDADIAALARKVEDRLGLAFAGGRMNSLRRGIATAAVEFGQADRGAFVRWLLSDRPEHTDIERFGGHLTVGETYFLRDRRTMEALEKSILPELVARNRKARRLRIWCAGCSTGEEPYTLAILLHRVVPDLASWSIQLLGTDISVQALRKAEAGVYSRWSLRDCSTGELEPYVRETTPGKFVVEPSLRSMVTFSFLNLAEDSYPSVATNCCQHHVPGAGLRHLCRAQASD